jgi:MFS transporter, DHA1 family, inner membrane transport protein
VALAIFVAGDVIGASANDISMVLFSGVLAGLGAALFSPTALSMACRASNQSVVPLSV